MEARNLQNLTDTLVTRRNAFLTLVGKNTYLYESEMVARTNS